MSCQTYGAMWCAFHRAAVVVLLSAIGIGGCASGSAGERAHGSCSAATRIRPMSLRSATVFHCKLAYILRTGEGLILEHRGPVGAPPRLGIQAGLRSHNLWCVTSYRLKGTPNDEEHRLPPPPVPPDPDYQIDSRQITKDDLFYVRVVDEIVYPRQTMSVTLARRQIHLEIGMVREHLSIDEPYPLLRGQTIRALLERLEKPCAIDDMLELDSPERTAADSVASDRVSP